MDGIHDLGGMMGFGRIEREANEPMFHEPWERQAFGILLQSSGNVGFSDDHLRANIEHIPPLAYLQASYYERWVRALEAFLDERNIVTQAEIVARMEEIGVPSRPGGGRGVTLDGIEAAVAEGSSARRDSTNMSARFRPTDRVRVRNDHPEHHTRAPRYTRGRVGEILIDHGIFVFPDTNARDLGECPQHCYTVKFQAREVWGEAAPSRDSLCVDLWESYLEPV